MRAVVREESLQGILKKGATQKFSTIHMLLFRVEAWIARWRPSGDGTPQAGNGEPLPFCCHSREGLPLKST
jgi:hypothetical protein